MDTIEYVDYIFDRYAYLGVAPDATQQEIHKVIKQRRAGLHTDKLAHVDEELVKVANRKRELVDSCAEVLEHDERRALFDQRLAWFKAEKPKLVSTSGVAIIDPHSTRFQYEELLADDLDNYDRMKEYAASLTGYDAREDAAAARRYKARPKDAELCEDYRYQVGKRLYYFTSLEVAAWAAAGLNTDDKTRGSAFHADEYVERTEKLIAYTRDAVVPELIGQRQNLVALGMSPPLLLLTYKPQDGTEAAPPAPIDASAEATDQTIKKVQDKFEERAGRIRDIAQQKQDALQELLSLSPTYIFNRPAEMVDGPYVVYVLKPQESGEPTLTTSFNFIKSGNNMKLEDVAYFEEGDTPLPKLRKQAKKGPPAIGILHSTQLGDVMEYGGMLLEASHAIGVLEDSLATAPATAPAKKKAAAAKTLAPKSRLS